MLNPVVYGASRFCSAASAASSRHDTERIPQLPQDHVCHNINHFAVVFLSIAVRLEIFKIIHQAAACAAEHRVELVLLPLLLLLKYRISLGKKSNNRSRNETQSF